MRRGQAGTDAEGASTAPAGGCELGRHPWRSEGQSLVQQGVLWSLAAGASPDRVHGRGTPALALESQTCWRLPPSDLDGVSLLPDTHAAGRLHNVTCATLFRRACVVKIGGISLRVGSHTLQVEGSLRVICALISMLESIYNRRYAMMSTLSADR